jgi:hypothetical protein
LLRRPLDRPMRGLETRAVVCYEGRDGRQSIVCIEKAIEGGREERKKERARAAFAAIGRPPSSSSLSRPQPAETILQEVRRRTWPRLRPMVRPVRVAGAIFEGVLTD